MSTSLRRWALAPLALIGLFGCVDEKIVYRDRDLFEEPLAAAGNFLGYSDEASKLSVCGNCHVEKQGDWIGTAHANAWSVAGDDAACGQCHAVSEAGNAVDVPAGFAATGEARYHDVQCESCHGPGLTHVSNPLESNAPLAAPHQTTRARLENCGRTKGILNRTMLPGSRSTCDRNASPPRLTLRSAGAVAAWRLSRRIWIGISVGCLMNCRIARFARAPEPSARVKGAMLSN